MKASRGAGKDQRKVRLARPGAMREEDVVCKVVGVDEGRERLTCSTRRVAEGTMPARLRFIRSSAALAMMCPTLLLMPARNAARLVKTWS
jgi:translation initiation factor 2 alpha subunit (eIF-2alpha)